MKLGIVGLPNVGKTTLFNAMTKQEAQTVNYLFSTVKANVGAVEVPDERLDFLAELYAPKKYTPATIEFVDLAGLVEGASKGEGLGNKFLADIRVCDAIVHVVRCFDDDNVLHVVGETDPLRDIDIINSELILADLEMVQRRLEKAKKNAKGGDKKFLTEAQVLERLAEHFNEILPARTFPGTEAEMEIIAESELLSLKPVIYAANMSESDIGDFAENDYYKQVLAKANEENALVLPVCAKIEQELSQLPEEERELFLEELGISESSLNRLIKCSYSLLGLISFLTAGPEEVRAWTIKDGSRAPKAAGKIHSDLERGFIRAEVVAFDDLKACGSMAAAKEKGLVRSEGKEYVMKDGDVTLIRFNV